jgi:hypothetical protein
LECVGGHYGRFGKASPCNEEASYVTYRVLLRC